MKHLFPALLLLVACSQPRLQPAMETLAFRLKPGEDLKTALQAVVERHGIDAGWVLTCAGSLNRATLRFANQPGGTLVEGPLEIVALSGTLSRRGSHLHLAVSDSTGKTTGGHLLEGNPVYTTAEIVIGWRRDLVFDREQDGTTPWKELQIRTR